MKSSRLHGSTMAGLITLSILVVGCGSSKVDGNTYQNNGSVVQLEFRSGGKAFVSMGPRTQTCTYNQNSKTVTLLCEREKTVFTVEDDGSLTGPPDGMMTRMTKKK